MNSSVLALTLATLALIGSTAGSLQWLKGRVKMGNPGVRVGPVPVVSDAGRLAATHSVLLPSDISGFQSRVETIGELELTFLPPDTTFGKRVYASSDGLPSATATVVLMGSDRTSIHRPEYCMTGAGWQIFKQTVQTISVPSDPSFHLDVQRFDMTQEFEVNDGQKRRVTGIFLFWFVADGMRTSSHSDRQWWGIREVLFQGRNPRWAYISFFSICEPGAEEATFQRLARLVGVAAPQIERDPTAATPQ